MTTPRIGVVAPPPPSDRQPPPRSRFSIAPSIPNSTEQLSIRTSSPLRRSSSRERAESTAYTQPVDGRVGPETAPVGRVDASVPATHPVSHLHLQNVPPRRAKESPTRRRRFFKDRLERCHDRSSSFSHHAYTNATRQDVGQICSGERHPAAQEPHRRLLKGTIAPLSPSDLISSPARPLTETLRRTELLPVL